MLANLILTPSFHWCAKIELIAIRALVDQSAYVPTPVMGSLTRIDEGVILEPASRVSFVICVLVLPYKQATNQQYLPSVLPSAYYQMD